MPARPACLLLEACLLFTALCTACAWQPTEVGDFPINCPTLPQAIPRLILLCPCCCMLLGSTSRVNIHCLVSPMQVTPTIMLLGEFDWKPNGPISRQVALYQNPPMCCPSAHPPVNLAAQRKPATSRLCNYSPALLLPLILFPCRTLLYFRSGVPRWWTVP